MPRIIVVDRAGTERKIDAEAGRSLMENLRDAGIDEVLALCGGCCSCATCHVYVDEPWMALVGEPGRDESDLLDSSDHRTTNSRLSCQIDVSEAHDGMRVAVTPEG